MSLIKQVSIGLFGLFIATPLLADTIDDQIRSALQQQDEELTQKIDADEASLADARYNVDAWQQRIQEDQHQVDQDDQSLTQLDSQLADLEATRRAATGHRQRRHPDQRPANRHSPG